MTATCAGGDTFHALSQKSVMQGMAGVQMVLRGASDIQHNFAAQPLCRVQLQLSLRNCLAAEVAAVASFGSTLQGGHLWQDSFWFDLHVEWAEPHASLH